eukprot:1707903-Rhodomonas_salina.1
MITHRTLPPDLPASEGSYLHCAWFSTFLLALLGFHRATGGKMLLLLQMTLSAVCYCPLPTTTEACAEQCARSSAAVSGRE